KRAEIAVHSKLDRYIEDNERDPTAATFSLHVAEGRFRLLEPLGLVIAERAGGIEVVEVHPFGRPVGGAEPAVGRAGVWYEAAGQGSKLEPRIPRERPN